jgi:hypothetical protein
MIKKKYAYFLAILLLALIILFVYNSGEISYNYKNTQLNNQIENLINVPINNVNGWCRNTCKYEMPNTIMRVLNDYNIKEVNKNANIIFPCTYDDTNKEIDEFDLNKNKNDANYFIIKDADQIVAKDYLWRNLVSYYGLEKSKTLMPNTYILYKNEDMNRFKTDYDKNKLYIMKKNIQRQEGLKITNDLNIIINGNKENYVVVQELLQNPYIITDNLNNQVNNRKINMRVYILVICKNNKIDVYVYKDGFMYYTKKSFIPGSMDSDANITTGYIDREVYKVNPLTLNDFRNYIDDTQRSLSLYENYYRTQGVKLSEIVFNRINNVIKDIFMANLNKICTNSKLNDKLSFQIFGADVAVDDKLDALLIEINKGPDLNSKDDRDGNLKYKLIADTFKIINIIENDNNNDFVNIISVNK